MNTYFKCNGRYEPARWPSSAIGIESDEPAMMLRYNGYSEPALSLLMVILPPHVLRPTPPIDTAMKILSEVSSHNPLTVQWMSYALQQCENGGLTRCYLRHPRANDVFVHIVALNSLLLGPYLALGGRLDIECQLGHSLLLGELFPNACDVLSSFGACSSSKAPNEVDGLILDHVPIEVERMRGVRERLAQVAVCLRGMDQALEVWHHLCCAVGLTLVPRILNHLQKLLLNGGESAGEEGREKANELVREMASLFELCELATLEEISLLKEHGYRGLIVGYCSASLHRIFTPRPHEREITLERRIILVSLLLSRTEEVERKYRYINRMRIIQSCIAHNPTLSFVRGTRKRPELHFSPKQKKQLNSDLTSYPPCDLYIKREHGIVKLVPRTEYRDSDEVRKEVEEMNNLALRYNLPLPAALEGLIEEMSLSLYLLTRIGCIHIEVDH